MGVGEFRAVGSPSPRSLVYSFSITQPHSPSSVTSVFFLHAGRPQGGGGGRVGGGGGR